MIPNEKVNPFLNFIKRKNSSSRKSSHVYDKVGRRSSIKYSFFKNLQLEKVNDNKRNVSKLKSTKSAKIDSLLRSFLLKQIDSTIKKKIISKFNSFNSF